MLRQPDSWTERTTARGLELRPLSAFPPSEENADPAGVVAAWMRGFLMRPHPDLGRPGLVCPYVSLSAKADLVWIATSDASDEQGIHTLMRAAVRAFEQTPSPPKQETFKSVLVAFPACVGEIGRRTLKAVQNRLRPESTRRGKMIGLFMPEAEDEGLFNPHFRPMRAPVPLLAIRSLVENDAPFVLRNPRLAPIYLWRFPLTGSLKLAGRLWR